MGSQSQEDLHNPDIVEEDPYPNCIKCRISSKNLKVFVNAIHCLGRVGKELSFEIDSKASTMILRSLNDSHSASNEFFFQMDFFDNFQLPHVLDQGNIETPTSFKCKMYVKTCESIFRSIRTVEYMDFMLDIDPESFSPQVLIFLLENHYKVRKTHIVRVSECQVMTAFFDKENCENQLKTRTYHLLTLLAHIHGTADICVTASKKQVRLQSYCSNPDEKTTVDSHEFSEYRYNERFSGETTDLIFGFKEFKALLQFCQMSDLDEVILFFQSTGSPVLLSTENPHVTSYFGQLVLSTMTSLTTSSSQLSSSQDSIKFQPQINFKNSHVLSQSSSTSNDTNAMNIRPSSLRKRNFHVFDEKDSSQVENMVPNTPSQDN